MNPIRTNDFIQISKSDHLFLVEKEFSGIYTARSVANLSTWFNFYYNIYQRRYKATNKCSKDLHKIFFEKDVGFNRELSVILEIEKIIEISTSG